MDNEIKETALKVSEYENEDKKRTKKVTLMFFILGMLSLIANILIEELNLPVDGFYEFIKGFTIGLPFGVMIIGILYVTGVLTKLYSCKKHKSN